MQDDMQDDMQDKMQDKIPLCRINPSRLSLL